MNRAIILASHGSLANGMLSAVEMIIGKVVDMYAFGLEQYESPQVIYDHVKQITNELTIVVCDLKGGSVYNQLIRMANHDNVCIISGMNLGLTLELALTHFNEDYRDVIESIVDRCKDGVELFDYEKALSENEKEEDSLW